MTDTANKCTYISQVLARVYRSGSGKGSRVHLDRSAASEDRERAARDLIEASQARRPCSGEYRVRRADGEYAWFHDMGVAYYNADGSYAGYIGTCVDITEHKNRHGQDSEFVKVC